MSMINEISTSTGELTADRRVFRTKETYTGWKLLGIWVGLALVAWAGVIGTAYVMWQLFLHLA